MPRRSNPPALLVLALAPLLGPVAACGDVAPTTPEADAGAFTTEPPAPSGPEVAPGSRPTDAGYTFEGGVLPGSRFVTKVESFSPGPCSGFGKASMPDVVFGPPHGAGDGQGGFDVVSLGVGGSIVVAFERPIVDGPGDDFVVFENAFFAGGDPLRPAADLGEVSVSADGQTWSTFPCTATSYPYGACAGWHPVYSSTTNGIAPTAPEAGGDRYDLAAIGVPRARFVRVQDKSEGPCPTPPVSNLGFDLDAVVVLHTEGPG